MLFDYLAALKFCLLALQTAWDAQAWPLIQLFQFGLSLFKHLKPRFYIESMNMSKATKNGPNTRHMLTNAVAGHIKLYYVSSQTLSTSTQM